LVPVYKVGDDSRAKEGEEMCAEEYHEPFEIIPEDGRDYHRALVSLIEELQAVDWYHQRVLATGDPELRDILEHNRDEEKEHAMMLLEYLRRNDGALSDEVRTFLLKDAKITELEEEETD
jgi:hypothetical protein